MELRDLVNRLFIHKLSTDSGGGRTKVELSGKTVIYKDSRKKGLIKKLAGYLHPSQVCC